MRDRDWAPGWCPPIKGGTNADVGGEAGGGVGVARGGFAAAAMERGAETPHRGGELPQRGFGLGGGASSRCSYQCVVPVVVEAPEPSSAAASGRMEIVLGEDVRVIVDATVHAGALARVLAVVSER